MPKIGLPTIILVNLAAAMFNYASWEFFWITVIVAVAWNAVFGDLSKRIGFVSRDRAMTLEENLADGRREIHKLREALAEAAAHLENLNGRVLTEETRLEIKITGQDAVFWTYHTDPREFEGHYERWKARTGRGNHQQQSQARSAPKTDWRAVLGVPTGASYDDVTAAYRRLAKRYHPDNRETGDAANMQRVNEAKEQADREFGK